MPPKPDIKSVSLALKHDFASFSAVRHFLEDQQNLPRDALKVHKAHIRRLIEIVCSRSNIAIETLKAPQEAQERDELPSSASSGRINEPNSSTSSYPGQESDLPHHLNCNYLIR